MQFETLSDFFAMGGYGFYVWLSFGSTAAIMAGIWWSSRRAHRNTLKEVEKQIRREARIKQAQEEQQGA